MIKDVVAVLINYRDAKRSLYCIESLLDNEVSRVIVWDNSEDNGVSLLELRKHTVDFENIDFIYSEKNIGFSKAINRLLVICAQRYINSYVLVINNDAVMLDNGIKTLVSALERSNDGVIVAPKINHAGRVSGAGFYNKWFALLAFEERQGYFRYPSGCCFLVDMGKVREPLFDEDFFMYGEDWALGWRLPAHAVVYLDDVLVNHEGSASSGLGSIFYEERMVAAHLILAKKLAVSDREYVLLILLRLFVLPLRACIRALRFHSFIPLYALFAGARIAWRGK